MRSPDLSHTIFLHFAVNAVDAWAPNTVGGGDDPMQTRMKTTLSASILIADGGLSIFCDTFTAKTDLKDGRFAFLPASALRSCDGWF